MTDVLSGEVRAPVVHEDFSAQKYSFSGYFFLVIGNRLGKLYAFCSSRQYVFILLDECKKHESDLRLDQITLPLYFVLDENWWLQNAGAEYMRNHNFRYRMYSIPFNASLPDAVLSLYWSPLCIKASGNIIEDLQGGLWTDCSNIPQSAHLEQK